MCPDWHADFGEWQYGDLDTRLEYPQIFCKDGSCAEVFSKTIGQYTGLDDKNGVKIFEGDIIGSANCGGAIDRGKVFWCDGRNSYLDVGFGVRWNTYSYAHGSVVHNFDTTLDMIEAEFSEVIGNIYDNPELVESEDENHDMEM